MIDHRAPRTVVRRGAVPFVALLLLGPATIDGCARRPDQAAVASATPASVDDTLRGIVRVTGTAPGALVLELAPERASAGAVDVSGADLDALRAAEGLEVTLFGRIGRASGVTPARSGFVVTRFSVRAADGIPATDGVLERADTGYALRLGDDSRLLLTSVPESLRAAVGQRIYWAGPLDRAPQAYGILTADRTSR